MRGTPHFVCLRASFPLDPLCCRRINLSTASVESLDALEAACEAASFGRNQETVLDESYRKAGKMDVDKFSLVFDADRSGLIDVVKTGLLIGKEEKKEVRVELYKLNVYGKDAFFKAHKDTPRGADMFGSLVVVFPTPHEGGSLILRHEDKEWTFDAAQLLASSTKRIAYVAFFSDVEHEVTRVLSGHRVTITYNLYWAGPPRVAPPSGLSVLHPLHASPSSVGVILGALLDDPKFLPNGGTLGFGLRHAYPFPNIWDPSMEDPLDALERWLKGGDTALFQAIKALSLEPLLRLMYESGDYSPLEIMMDRMIELEVSDAEPEYILLEEGGVGLVAKYFGPPPKKRPSWYRDSPDEYAPRPDKVVDVHWITRCESWNGVRSEYTAYGNEASTEYLYMNVALLVDIGPAGNRTDINAVQGVHSPRIVKKGEDSDEKDEAEGEDEEVEDADEDEDREVNEMSDDTGRADDA
ncbi:hypothetical protein C8T65DRAFT_582830 [Cerioporus squamosus]|nr:hypothetical protein C8T65DRAFT_582830 [Cerioporus squamosus]